MFPKRRVSNKSRPMDNVQNCDSYINIIAVYCDHYLKSENKFHTPNADFLMLNLAVHRVATIF
jgi:hypothetical protein